MPAMQTAQMSPALQSFLQQDTEIAEAAHRVDDTTVEGAMAPLGDLDITTSDNSLQGILASTVRTNATCNGRHLSTQRSDVPRSILFKHGTHDHADGQNVALIVSISHGYT